MKTKPTPEQVADAYLAYAANIWSREYLIELIRKEPDVAWDIICRLIDSAPDGDSAAYIAAGPLEEFVVARGEQYLEAISSHARENPKMQQALGGVWQESQMPKKVWRQIQKLAGKS